MSTEPLFHKPGFIYFWILNDELPDHDVERMIDAFASARVSAVCLHPRAGLLLPYGGDDWFAFIKRTVARCEARGLDVWLYDEDPYPSGAVGGLMVMDHPEFEALGIQQDIAPAELEEGDLFVFKAGKLLWCGLVNETTGQSQEHTTRVGVVRRRWQEIQNRSSDWYYPNTPLYYCERWDAHEPELAIRLPEVPEGFTFQALTARPCGKDRVWGSLPDTLNPEATRYFIRCTHERYLKTVGDRFNKSIFAMFTDEPKFFGSTPWTPGLFDLFAQDQGYDLQPRLWQLFSRSNSPEAMLTRLHYRQWIGKRFKEVWLDPVAQWCRDHKLPLVGHISPEDDPVEQTACVTNLMPLFDEFTIPGIDLIIPAVGDDRHPVINVGVVSATGRGQQNGQSGVLSETLAVSGLDATVQLASGILQWQAMMGVTTQVIHAAFQSVRDKRLYDAPPDWGPMSHRWPEMVQLEALMKPIQEVTREAAQIAPVAILWPIRSFSAIPFEAFSHDSPLRDELVALLLECLARQVGVHFIDEDMLGRLKVEDGQATVGLARYSHLIVPRCVVIHQESLVALGRLREQGVKVMRVDQGPPWFQTADDLIPAADLPPALKKSLESLETMAPAILVKQLPRLLPITPDHRDVRCTIWEKQGRRTALVMTLDQEPVNVAIQNQQLTLQPRQVRIIPLEA